MKAAVYNEYGPPTVLELTELEKPQPNDDEILIKIYAATVTSGDVRLRGSDFPPLFWLPARLIFGLFKPKKKILGHELAGVIEGKGKNITKFNIGDSVFGTTTMLNTGSYAEYICVPQEWKHGVISLKPVNLNFKEAAALPIGGMTAMYLLEKANIKAGQKILVYGASGSVGSYAVQLAKQQGTFVMAICSSSNFDMVKSLGADSSIDYKKEDYSLLEDKFDIVFDAVGKTTKARAKKVLNNEGVFVSVKMLTTEKSEHLKRIKELAEKEKLIPFIDRCFPLNEIVSAHEYVDKGHKKGNVVIEIKK
ncbi:NAD(P)-dependent alcohol dehydrogenase [Flagellimonas sp. CMM7]|uniref:NAD(P)-dependent alcohol dehydrogenase n=1 Tax=Flagellimonas sp. CMM7 TaxID=2654676 RepID=UPI0013CFC9C1|nr:NAD(P)-dependent alcohol dehydrogenase [Flagellimonas sp. CMM7]UII81646.1 NAD(P)-dependent alcohol dehydrogenase [Flagellimonas sp. CMM7]